MLPTARADVAGRLPRHSESPPAVIRTETASHKRTLDSDSNPDDENARPLFQASSSSAGSSALRASPTGMLLGGNGKHAASWLGDGNKEGDLGSSKRFRISSTSTVSLGSSTSSTETGLAGALPSFKNIIRETRDAGLLAPDMMTPDENFQILRETSQNMLETMSLSQQATQECTQQTAEESPNMCIMRLVLHPHVESVLTDDQKRLMEREGLLRIELSQVQNHVQLGREGFSRVFPKDDPSGVKPVTLSRKHCNFECSLDANTGKLGVFVTDTSMNGIRIDGIAIEKRHKYRLQHGQTITLLSSKHGELLLGYVTEDPHVVAAQVSLQPRQDVSVLGRSQESQQQLEVEEHTLGVLFAAPLVGKDVKGKYHPIAELDIKREYSILQQSLKEASRYARRPVMTNENGVDVISKTFFQYPHQISVCAKFANTENFRTMVTIGCRALHFSGHGDESNLYFEDGMGLVHPIPHSSLQELFSAGSGGVPKLRLVFVSACSSAPLAHAFVACGIPHVIGVRVKEKIEDYAAIEFTKSFYLALGTGKSVGDSFIIAQQAVAKSPNIRSPTEVAEKFMLLPEHADHSEIIFPLVTKEARTAAELGPRKLKRYPKLWFDDLPAICQGFCNRAVEVYKICLALMLTQSRITRLVTITGERGIGKTAVAHAVANYVGPRITSEGGVRIFSVARLEQEKMDERVEQMRKGRSFDELRSQVLKTLEEQVTQHIRQHKAKIELNGQQLLIILDGCDCLLKSDARRDRFKVLLSDLLTNNACLKIVLTARESISTNGAVAGHGERVYQLSPFNEKMSARLLLGLASRPIRVDELTKAPQYGSTTDKLELIATHPALLQTLGIPKRIADLAGRLNQMQMDEVAGDSHMETSE